MSSFVTAHILQLMLFLSVFASHVAHSLNQHGNATDKLSKQKSWIQKENHVYGYDSKGDKWFDVLSTAVEIPLAILAPLGNVLTMAAVVRCDFLRTVANMYIVSLALSDCLVGLLLPWKIALNFLKAGNHAETDKKTSCLVLNCGFFTLMAASMLTITSISVDRFLHVRFPFRYPRFATPRVAYLVIALVWTLAVIVGTMPVLQASELSTGNHYRMACHVYFMQYEYRQYQLFYQGGLFLVCSAVSLAAYLYICLVAIRHRREIARIAPTCQLGEFRDEPSPGAARAPTVSTDEDGSGPTGVSTITGTFQRLTHENRQGVNVAMTPRASRAKVIGSTAQPLGGTCLKTGSDKGGVILNPRQAGEAEKPDQVTVVISDEDRKSVSSASGVAQTGTDTREPKELPSITAVVSMSPLVWSEKPMSVVLETPPTKTDYIDLGKAASRPHKTYQHVGIADLTNVPRSSIEPTLPDVPASDDANRRLGYEENENESTNQSNVDLTADETLPTFPKHSCHPSNLSEREEHLLDECPVVSAAAGTKKDVSRVSSHHGKELTSHYPEQPSKSAKGTSGVPNNLQSRHLDQPSTSSKAVLSSHLSLKLRSTPHISRVPKCCEDNTSSPGSCPQHVRPPAPGAIVVTLYFFVFGLFFVLWSPTFLVLLFGVYADGELSWLRVLFPIGLLNSVCNVIVYALKCDEMRCVMKQILVGCFYRKCAETNICRGFRRAA